MNAHLFAASKMNVMLPAYTTELDGFVLGCGGLWFEKLFENYMLKSPKSHSAL